MFMLVLVTVGKNGHCVIVHLKLSEAGPDGIHP